MSGFDSGMNRRDVELLKSFGFRECPGSSLHPFDRMVGMDEWGNPLMSVYEYENTYTLEIADRWSLDSQHFNRLMLSGLIEMERNRAGDGYREAREASALLYRICAAMSKEYEDMRND